jgi:hypothetical protein
MVAESPFVCSARDEYTLIVARGLVGSGVTSIHSSWLGEGDKYTLILARGWGDEYTLIVARGLEDWWCTILRSCGQLEGEVAPGVIT